MKSSKKKKVKWYEKDGFFWYDILAIIGLIFIIYSMSIPIKEWTLLTLFLSIICFGFCLIPVIKYILDNGDRLT